MIRASRRMPDFAGVALVDILANGVAMLIIVIVVTIAARMEREERYAEQVDEVAAVMSHKFSTSLVLNSLAASPPARLHDYEASPLDQVLDPELLPILELHRGFAREFYYGTIWTRRDLLEEHSGLSAWLAGFSDLQRARLRVDVYDVAQFYLAMSILREHGIRAYHWHFLKGTLSRGEAARCPPGVAAKDCPGGGVDPPAPLPQLAAEERAAGGLNDAESLLSELLPGPGEGSGGPGSVPGFLAGGTGSAPGPMPGGIVPGIAGSTDSEFGADGSVPGVVGQGSGTGVGPRGTAGAGLGAQSDPESMVRGQGFGKEPGLDPGAASTLGSFPGAREGGMDPSAGAGGGQSPRGGLGRGEGRQASGTEGTQSGDGSQINIRIALPESIRRDVQAGSEVGVPALEAMFGIILHYLGELQDSLDGGGTPSRQIDGFAERIQTAFRAPPPITDAERKIARDLALKFALLPHLGDRSYRSDPLALRTASGGSGANAVLAVVPNRLNDALWVDRGGDGDDGGARGDGKRNGEGGTTEGPSGLTRDSEADHGEAQGGARQDGRPPARGQAAIALNAYPGIWKGLEIRIEPYSVLLMPPEVREPERMRWRAVAYISPALDDFIVGFVFANMDAEGRLRIQADANRVRVEGQPLFTEYRESTFGSRGWLVSLYAALAAGLLLLGAGWRFLARLAERPA